MKKLLSLFKNKGVDIIDTGLTIINDKTHNSEDSFIKDKMKKGKSISSKRVLNFTGFGAIISTGLYRIFQDGITWEAITLVGIGAAYSYGMTFLTQKSEK